MVRFWSILIVVGLISYSEEKECTYPYEPVSDLCLILLQGKMNWHESVCSSLSPRGIPLRRRLDDAQWDAFKEYLMKRTMAYPAAFLGMQKQGGVNGGTTWKFSNGEVIQQDDYKLWAKDHPSSFNACGALTKNSSYRVESVSCDQESVAICEKDVKPCYHDSMYYSEYFGKCLSISNNKGNYSNIHTHCEGGHVLSVKNETDLERATSLLYTVQAPVYGGLRKMDGKWFFNQNGQQVEETERLGPSVKDYPTGEECGVWGVATGDKVIMYTTSCESTVRFMCVPVDN